MQTFKKIIQTMTNDGFHIKNSAAGLACVLVIMLMGGATAAAETGETSTVRVSHIIDADVVDANAQLIGEVDDLILRRSGRVKKLTVEFGGLLDLGDKLVAVPFKSVDWQNGRVTLELTEKQLSKKNEYDYHAHDLQPAYYYRPSPTDAPVHRFPQPGLYYGPYAHNPSQDPYTWVLSPSKNLASTIMNRRMINEAGEGLGIVVDLVIDRSQLTVSQIVIESNLLSDEVQRVALPYKPLGFTAYGLTYDISLKEFKQSGKRLSE